MIFDRINLVRYQSKRAKRNTARSFIRLKNKNRLFSRISEMGVIKGLVPRLGNRSTVIALNWKSADQTIKPAPGA